jgi:N6-adenosine-specific RNA methylase IME4
MSELAIPDPLSQPVPAGWGLALLGKLDQIDDLGPLDDSRAELAGHVTAYRKKRIDVTELRIAERMVEIRMGELLPPPPGQGARTDLTSVGQPKLDLATRQQQEFRDLAEYREQIILWIKGGTIGRAALLARAAAKRAGYTMPDLSELPRCAVVYADPPWRYDHNEASSRDIENQYTTMTTAAISALEVPAGDDSVLFMWATNPKLTEALDVMNAWGFSYRTNMVWVKDRIGMGYYARSQHELLLIGKRGNLPMPDPSSRPASAVTAPRGEHSRKPEVFYELIETMYDGLPLAEMFARQARPGWTAWGYQA